MTWPVDDRTNTKSDMAVDVEIDHYAAPTSSVDYVDGNNSIREYISVVVHNLIEGEEDEKVRDHLVGNKRATSVEVMKTCESVDDTHISGPVVVVRRSNVIHNNSDRGIFVHAFPELFPYGRGGQTMKIGK